MPLKEEGKFECYYNHKMCSSVINDLKAFGYKIADKSNQKDGVAFLISWEDADTSQISMRGVQDTV